LSEEAWRSGSGYFNCCQARLISSRLDSIGIAEVTDERSRMAFFLCKRSLTTRVAPAYTVEESLVRPIGRSSTSLDVERSLMAPQGPVIDTPCVGSSSWRRN
jgi:hypothetical protein